MQLSFHLSVDYPSLLYLILEEPLVQIMFVYLLAHVPYLFPVHLTHIP